MKFNHYIFGIVLVAGSLAACDNQDIEFDDYKFQAVYFGSQYPVRTLQLGDDEFMDLTLDNQHKFKIMANAARIITIVIVSLTLWWMKVFAPTFFMPIMILLCYLCLRSIISWLLIRLYFRRVLNSTV